MLFFPITIRCPIALKVSSAWTSGRWNLAGPLKRPAQLTIWAEPPAVASVKKSPAGNFPMRTSRPDTLDDAQRALSWHDPSQLQSRDSEQLRKFLLGALAPSHDKHLHIKELATVRVVTRGDHAVDNKHPSLLTHSGATVRENRSAALIVPVVEDALHHVGIAAFGHRLEEVPRFHDAAFSNVLGCDVLILSGARDDRGLIEEHSLQFRIRLEDGAQEAAVSPAHVHDRPDS